MKPFRFGVSIWHARSRAEFVEKAREVEAFGYDTLTLPDHLTDRIAPMPALISAAEATKHLRVGTNVLNNDLRHPVLVTRESATVDLLTDGRFQLGLGAGSIQSEYEQAGQTFRHGGSVPPDLSGWRVSGVDDRVRRVRESAGGERYARQELNALVQRVVVTDARRGAAEELASRWTQLSADEMRQSPFALIGTVDQMVGGLQARRQRWGISYYLVHEPYLDAFAHVVARLAGK